MYQHARVFIYEKEILEQAIRNAFRQPLSVSVKIVIDRYGNEDILLTENQLQRLQQEKIIMVVYDQHQIMNYAHSCFDKETLKKILD